MLELTPKSKKQRSFTSIILRKEGRYCRPTLWQLFYVKENPPVVFMYVFHLVNIAGVNEQTLYNKTRNSVDAVQNRCQFLKNLAMSLMKPEQNRAQLQSLPAAEQSTATKSSS